MDYLVHKFFSQYICVCLHVCVCVCVRALARARVSVCARACLCVYLCVCVCMLNKYDHIKTDRDEKNTPKNKVLSERFLKIKSFSEDLVFFHTFSHTHTHTHTYIYICKYIYTQLIPIFLFIILSV